MCDTSFVTQKFTGSTKRIFAKNSDREPNEAQEILHLGRKSYPNGTPLKTTYITIPQAEKTYEIFLSKPFQMWGAEMGVNEFGVCIGNEAVFTNIKKRKKNDGLTGMDLIRLALERSESATAALNLIITLLETYGQDANGGYENKNFFYHNSFLIGDAKDAYVLETADRYWAYKRIDSYYAISNGLTIDTDYDRISESLKQTKPISFREKFSDLFYTKMSHCQTRRANNESNAMKLKQIKNNYIALDAFQVLKSHHGAADDFRPDSGNMSSICLHATGPITPNDTTGSLVVEWDTDPNATNAFSVFFTGTANPCLSLFKPFFFGTKGWIGNKILSPKDKFDDSLWWKQAQVSRKANFDYKSVKEELAELTNGFEQKMYNESLTIIALEKKEKFQQEQLQSHMEILDQTIKKLEANQIGKFKWSSPFYSCYWMIQNKKAKIRL